MAARAGHALNVYDAFAAELQAADDGGDRSTAG